MTGIKNILSLGLGVQSTALYFMSSIGELPPVDDAIFVDLGKEKKKTYEYLEFLLDWQKKNNGIPITVVRNKNLYTDLLNQTNSTAQRWASIPAYTKNEDGTTGMLRRQCTNEYKIGQVDHIIRFHIYKSEARKRLPLTRIWKGISYDESERINIPIEAWKISVYPFCGWETYHPGKARKMESDFRIMTRYNLMDWYEKNNIMPPPKSSCVFCPYQSERSWYEMQVKEPEDFEAACLVDDAIRNLSKKGITQPIFLHESCTPLREIEFLPDAPDLFSGDCSGTCHN